MRSRPIKDAIVIPFVEKTERNVREIPAVEDDRIPFDWDEMERLASEQPYASEDQEEVKHPLANYLHYDLNAFTPDTFVLDGLLCDGLTLIAGATGVGKTSALVPLLLKVAHICAPDDPLRPSIRRRVIYISEDTGQVLDIMTAVRVAGHMCGIDMDEVMDFFRVVPAVRMDAENIVKAVEDWEALTYTNKSRCGKFTYDAKPLVSIDTANATIDLDNENDNSEVGKVIAILKQNFNGIPGIITGHTSKVNKRAEIKALSGRGAGAWEADVNQVCYLVSEDDGTRWLEVAESKHRFHTEYAGLRLDCGYAMQEVVNRVGERYLKRVNFSIPTALKTDERADMKAEAETRVEEEKEVAKGRDRTIRTERMIELIRHAWANPETVKQPSRDSVKIAARGNKVTAGEYLQDMIDLERILEIEIPPEQRLNGKQKTILFALSAVQFSEYKRTGIRPMTADGVPKSWLKK